MALRTPLSVTPHLYMGDSTGRPLDKGVVYFGEQDKDPEFYPINLFSDDALTKPLAQPVHTKGGYLYDKGDMVEPHAKELIYSVKVLDSYGRKVFYKGAMMRNSWNDDVIEQINTAIIGSADAARQVAIDITNDAINNTAIEGGVLADTFVVVDGSLSQRTVNKGLESIADLSTIKNPKNGLRVYVKSYHAGLGKGGGYFTYDSTKASVNNGGTVINGWVRDRGVIDVFQFGAKADGVSDDSVAIQKAIDVCTSLGGHKLYVLTGTYYLLNSLILKDGVSLIGEGSDRTIFNIGKNQISAITTPKPTEKPLTQTSDLLEGDRYNLISNTCKEGDVIRYQSSKIFTQRWGEEGRPYYLEAEMLEVDTATSTRVDFKGATFINCTVTDSKSVVYFTPTKYVSVSGLTIIKDKDIVLESAWGIYLDGAMDSSISDVETRYFDNAGISLTKCVRISMDKLRFIGGNEVTGLCYGLVFVDGTRDCTAYNITGEHCRHTIAAGGTGWAVTCYNTVIGVVTRNDTKGSLDTHSASAFFTYSNIRADSIGYMSGLGHRLTDVIAYGDSGGKHRLSVSGKNLHYTDITLYNHSLNTEYVVVDSTFTNISLISERFDIISLRPGSYRNTFNGLKIICTGSSNATSSTEASGFLTNNSKDPIVFLAQTDCVFKNIFVEGFPGLTIAYPGVTIDGITAVNCGWKSSLYNHTGRALHISNLSNVRVSNLKMYRTNNKLEIPQYALFLEPGSGQPQTGLQLSNFVMQNPDGTKFSTLQHYTNSNIVSPRMFNIVIDTVSNSSSINTINGLYVDCSFTKLFGRVYDQSVKKLGTSEERPVTYLYGDYFFDKTLQQPIWYATSGKWVKADGTLA